MKCNSFSNNETPRGCHLSHKIERIYRAAHQLEAEMPVDTRTHQPFGLLHGGASAALAETLGSMAGFMMTRDGQCVVGTELNATHHRPVSEGKVRGVCQPLHLGRQNQSWEIVVFDEQGRRCCTCRLGTAVLG
ncbi:TPA: hotdog fold thioesterase [Escherichia coli]|nr:hotdog fold thioesterase [Escherichia coli]